jgi:hypothetical protein
VPGRLGRGRTFHTDAMRSPHAILRTIGVAVCAAVAFAACAVAAGPVRGPALPEIRVSAENRVPACVTPERLTLSLLANNPGLDARYRGIAQLYKTHGETLGIRWDYAFFQMQLETNSLSFRRGGGEPGDVRAKQNNFAGIGATGGGVPGESFPDISTGVLAQMQHLLAYAGQRVESPVAARTREVQADVISESLALRRPVRFSDLTNRWAADRTYSRSLEAIANRFHDSYCKSGMETADEAPAGDLRRDDSKPDVGASELGQRTTTQIAAAAGTCDVWSASFGGATALLIRSAEGARVNYTVLQVEAGQEQSQADAFIAKHARNGQAIARFSSRDQALARAFELCPGPS